MSANIVVLIYGADAARRAALMDAAAVRGHSEGVSWLVADAPDSHPDADVRINADALDADRQMLDVLATHSDFRRVGLFGAAAGGLEVSAGAIVHGANLPFGGLGMATAQAALLTRAAEPMADRGRVVWVALLSAAIKSLSPAGQRIRPMVAIAMQGWLYSRALRLLGWNRLAVAVGGFLMGAWACSQGMLLQWLLVGDALIVALETLVAEAAAFFGGRAPPLVVLVIGWVFLHGAMVAAGTTLAWRQRFDPAPRILTFGLSRPSQDRRWLASLRQSLRELLRPAFWLPLLLVLGALAWAGEPQQALVFVALRALLIGFLLMLLVQRLDLSALPQRLQKLGHWGPALAWRQALEQLSLQNGNKG